MSFGYSIPWVLVVWIMPQDGSNVQRTRYYENFHDCNVALTVVKEEIASISSELRLGHEVEAACMSSIAIDVDTE